MCLLFERPYCFCENERVYRGTDPKIRRAEITFDAKLDVLAKLVKSIVERHGHAPQSLIDSFYQAGYTHASLMETVIAIGDKIITNYLYALTGVPIDWPQAQPLEIRAFL
jgi:alkylhydroperoxidase family enzyme